MLVKESKIRRKDSKKNQDLDNEERNTLKKESQTNIELNLAKLTVLEESRKLADKFLINSNDRIDSLSPPL